MPLVSPGYLVPRDVESEHGFQTAFVLGVGALGASVDHVVPGAFFEIPVTVVTTFTTSATVANRTVSLQAIGNDGQLLDFSASNLQQTAGLTLSYRWSLTVSTPYSVAGVYVAIPLFAFVFPSGYRLRMTANGIQAGDQFLATQIVVQQLATGMELDNQPQPLPVDTSRVGLVSVPITSSPAPAPTQAPAPAPAPAPTTTTTTTTVTTPTTSPTELGSGSSAGSSPGVSRL